MDKDIALGFHLQHFCPYQRELFTFSSGFPDSFLLRNYEGSIERSASYLRGLRL
jgi:hypothetical protein